MNIATGMLVFSRPIHTALALAFFYFNRSQNNDLHAFYGVYRNTRAPSKALDRMLKVLDAQGLLTLHYLHEQAPQNCGGSVDTLVQSLSSLHRYDAFIKIDDDVLIGAGTDNVMVEILLELEREGVYLLMAQVVRAHLRRGGEFVWETKCKGHHIIQRARGGSPMETYTAISQRFLDFLKRGGKSISCDDGRGTFMGFARKLTDIGGRAGLVLTPTIPMQHIGLTTTIEKRESDRGWAPATSWDPPDKVILLPHFDFARWEEAHKAGTQKNYAVGALDDLQASAGTPKAKQALETIRAGLEQYAPNQDDVPLPRTPQRLTHSEIVRRDSFKPQRIAGIPQVVKRVIVRTPIGKIAHAKR